MTVITGTALRYDDAPVDYVILFDWATGNFLKRINPNALGVWQYTYYDTINIGITYSSNGCQPLTHGGYTFEWVNEGLITNPTFNVNLSGWQQSTPGYFKWVNGRAYHASSSAYRHLLQVVNYVGNVTVVAHVTVVSGVIGLYIDAPGGLITINIGVGEHRVEQLFNCNNSSVFFSREFGYTSEFYIHSVKAFKI